MAKNSGFNYYPEDVNAIDEKGNCALYYAIEHNDEDFINFLLDLEADVNLPCNESLNTPLHKIFATNNPELIIRFLEKGGNLNSLNKFGQTPLAFANL